MSTILVRAIVNIGSEVGRGVRGDGGTVGRDIRGRGHLVVKGRL